MEQEAQEKATSQNRKKWLKRIGAASFLFFLLKGIAWIVLGLMAWKGCS